MRINQPEGVKQIGGSNHHIEPPTLLRRLAFELRLSLSWTWLLPVAGTALVVIVMATSGTPTAQRAFVMRESLELGLPLVSAFLVVPLLEREWVQGTLAQLALRQPIVQVLFMRLALVVIYLALVATAATIFGWQDVPSSPRSPVEAAHWLATSLFIALVPTLTLSSLALLITHAVESEAAGYLAAIALWLGCLLGALLLPPDGHLRAFLLFSWSFPPIPDPSGWLTGKLALLTAAVVLFGAQIPCLRHEARLIRNMHD